LGHQHPKMIQAIKDQADVLCMVAPPFANDQRSEAGRLIVEKANRDGAGGHFEKVFFTNAGAEAVENAVRLAKGYTGRMKVLSAYRSYHGGTALSVGLTGEPRRLENEPSVPGLVKFWGPYPYRSAFHSSSPEEETERALQHLRDTIVMEGTDKVAAIIFESVVGTNGILVPPPGYLEGLRALCDEFGIVWIADEVMAGFGRAGQWFAWQNWDAQPDLICFAKGVNSGYVPLGGVVISSAIAHAYDNRMFAGGLTYSGHPLACATAVASIGIFEDEGVLAHARHLGDDIIGPALRDMAERHASVGEVRGLGVFWAVELVTDPATREPAPPATVGAVVAECKRNGLWPLSAGNRIHVVPPCNTPDDLARNGLAILDAALSVADDAMS
ncbi:MAG TPA: aminotransferase class III-fold pyridoxal phosphate-dependent enzyme, partial [Ilumatobacteraceae bacterium]|nr:aminotransferase class III-fold pyridoxal phosphate-dependent enzyme [Ilumatobacteraceae bacterium]